MRPWAQRSSLLGRALIAVAAVLIAVGMYHHISAAGNEKTSAAPQTPAVLTPSVAPGDPSAAWTDARTVEELLAQGSTLANPVPEPGTLNIVLGTLAVLAALGAARGLSNRF